MSEYRTVTAVELTTIIEEFGYVEFQDEFGNDLVATSFNRVDSQVILFRTILTDGKNQFNYRAFTTDEFYALVPHKMDSVVFSDSVVKAMESAYALMMACNSVNKASTQLDWAYQNNIYGQAEKVLVNMLIDVSDGDTEWANNVLNSIISSGEVRYILAQWSATPAEPLPNVCYSHDRPSCPLCDSPDA